MSNIQHSCSLGKKIENIEVSVYHPQDKNLEKTMFLDRIHERTVLFFYPADFSIICPTELEALNTYKSSFHKYDAKVYVVSRDSEYTHQQWISTDKRLEGFDIDMISDRDAIFGDIFGIIDEKSKNYQRATIILDKLGRIQSIEIMPINIGRSISELVRKIASLQHVLHNPKSLCSEGRHEGEEFLQETITKKNTEKKFFSS